MFQKVIKRTFKSLQNGTNKCVILSSCRTPIGQMNGALKNFSGVELCAISVKGAIERANVDSFDVEELIVGNSLMSGLGQAPSKQVSVLSGLGDHCVTSFASKVCAAGTKALGFGAMSIVTKQRDLVICSGFESMSNAPYVLKKARYGYNYGNGELIDSCESDGLIDVSGKLMGLIGDEFSEKFNISREEQDAYAIESYRRAQEANDLGLLKNEIIPIEIKNKKGEISIVDEDEQIKKFNLEKVPKLKTPFSENGYLTAANCSPFSDGAASIIISSDKFAEEKGIEPIAEILGYDDIEQYSEHLCTSPSKAVFAALEKAGLTMDDVDYLEIHEPFAAVPVENIKILGIERERANVFGGSISFGHPLGMSGARIICTLLNVLKEKNGKIGVAVTCNASGGGSAVVIENLLFKK